MKTITGIFVIVAVTSSLFLTACKRQSEGAGGQMPHQWTSKEPAAADSVEGGLRAKGKQWKQSSEQITVGCYVQDILEGRFDQPKGRGAIGKVTEISPEGKEPRAATVDFGRGYVVGLNLSEITRVNVDE